MKLKISVLVLTISLLCTPLTSKAWFMDSMVNGMTSVANNMIDEAGEVSGDMLQLMSKLSDDIGMMADRILIMADKIGEMADRIVATEELMTTTMVQMQDTMVGISDTGAMSSDNTALLTTPQGSAVSLGDIPAITIQNSTGQYLLYVAATPQVSNDSASVLIADDADLFAAWPVLSALAEDGEIYIAVKTIDGDITSNRSNIVLLYL